MNLIIFSPLPSACHAFIASVLADLLVFTPALLPIPAAGCPLRLHRSPAASFAFALVARWLAKPSLSCIAVCNTTVMYVIQNENLNSENMNIFLSKLEFESLVWLTSFSPACSHSAQFLCSVLFVTRAGGSHIPRIVKHRTSAFAAGECTPLPRAVPC